MTVLWRPHPIAVVFLCPMSFYHLQFLVKFQLIFRALFPVRFQEWVHCTRSDEWCAASDVHSRVRTGLFHTLANKK